MSDQASNSAQLLTLTRAARLVGVSRGALQKKIKNGDLPTFEGMVKPEDLMRAYPNTRLEDTSVIEHFAHIKDEAFAHRMRERLLPEPEVLAERLAGLGRELARTKALVERYKTITDWLYDKFNAYEKTGGAEARAIMGPLKLWLRHELEKESGSDDLQSLVVKESFLRLMTAHVRLLPSHREFFVEGSDSILDAALRAGVSLRYGCSNGNCGLCKARVASGKTLPVRHHDYVFSDAEKNQGYVLLCSNTAVSDLEIEAEEIGGARDIPKQEIAARVKKIDRLGDDMALLHLQTPRTKRLQFLAGQSVTLETGNGADAEYPVASCPCDDRNLQFHVRRIPGERLADYVFRKLKNGDIVSLSGPQGDFTLREDSPHSLLFLAHGNGFAPVKSLIEHAMARDTAETLHLYWLAGKDGHYLNNLCRAWADALDNFQYTPLTAEASKAGTALKQVGKDHPDLAGFDVYAAGPAPFLTAVRKFLRDSKFPEDRLVTTRVDG
ncbi:MAG: 2Fe-2S iron-sulfur cluster binding domain-containing protein [Gammaproteobacteria bacterium]|nr:2Fe-2S iron-sulfur cluster binding domain-containing protein [Gammaproteobacteria bacterium]